MMDYTDRHCRMLLRLISQHTVLYTEMVTAAAIVRGRDPGRLLAFDPAEHPVVLQIGGSEPSLLATAARAGIAAGYREINLNVGCPSERVTVGRFGACLMIEPELVADCLKAMSDALGTAVSVKCRIGVDDQDIEHDLDRFIAAISKAGCRTVIVHARKAWLKGLSPKENREIPPLDYGRVHRLKRDFPDLTIILNGGLLSLEAALDVIATRDGGPALDGAMIGRAAYDDPYMLATADRLFFGDHRQPAMRAAVLDAYLAYAARETARGARTAQTLRPLSGLYRGCNGARAWRQTLARVAAGATSRDALSSVASRLVPLAA